MSCLSNPPTPPFSQPPVVLKNSELFLYKVGLGSSRPRRVHRRERADIKGAIESQSLKTMNPPFKKLLATDPVTLETTLVY